MTARVLIAVLSVLSPSEVNLVVTPEPGAAEVRLAAAIYSGSADDPPHKEGLAALTAAVVAMVAGEAHAAGDLAVTAGKDLMVISGAAPPGGAGRLVERLTAVLVAPDLDQERLDRARAAQAARLEGLASDGAALADELFDRMAFPEHPYAHPAAGTRASLAGITLEDVREFHQRHFLKGNLAVAAAGAVEASLAPRLRALLDPLSEGSPARLERPLSFASRPRVGVVEAPGLKSAHVRVGLPLAVPRAHPEHPALLLAADLARRAAGAEVVSSAGPGGDGCGSSARLQPAFRLDLEVPPEAAASRLRAALRSVAGLTTGDAPADPPGAALDLAAGLAASGAVPPAEFVCPLADLLHRTPGWRQRLPAALEAAASSWQQTVRRHVPMERLNVVAAVPDARTFVRMLLSADPPVEARGTPALTEDDVDVLSLDQVLGGS